MAFDAFLKIEGIDGDSTDKDHKGEIEILSFSWGETNTSPSNKGGGGGAGKVSMQDFHFTMQVSSASPKLMVACASGKHFTQATLTCRKAGGEQRAEFMKIKLTDILVSSYLTEGNTNSEEAPLPTDQISLNFSKIEFLFSTGRGETTADATRG
jgi:type VI secretion system secreted protein Hcp